MDTGYPALITEPLASPDPKSQNASAAVKPTETQGEPNGESPIPPTLKTPVA